MLYAFMLRAAQMTEHKWSLRVTSAYFILCSASLWKTSRMWNTSQWQGVACHIFVADFENFFEVFVTLVHMSAECCLFTTVNTAKKKKQNYIFYWSATTLTPPGVSMGTLTSYHTCGICCKGANCFLVISRSDNPRMFFHADPCCVYIILTNPCPFDHQARVRSSIPNYYPPTEHVRIYCMCFVH